MIIYAVHVIICLLQKNSHRKSLHLVIQRRALVVSLQNKSRREFYCVLSHLDVT